LSKTDSKKTTPPDFEKSLAELETLVATLEKGELPLEETLKQFERGIALSKRCQTALKSAEQRVEILLGDDDAASTGAFDVETDA
jgi:exodeoxyribonuclease VII small subunit